MKTSILLVLIMFTTIVSSSQVIDINKFDRFDSVLTVSTKDRALGKIDYQNLDKDNIFIKVGRFVSFKNGKPSIEKISAYVIIKPKSAVSFDSKTTFKVIFNDNQVKSYKNEAEDQVWGEGDFATFYFTIQKNDPLNTKSIKAVKAEFGGYVIEIDTTEVSKDIVIKMIDLVKSVKAEPK